MDDYIIFILGTFISCFINSVILFQFIEDRNERVYDNHFFYYLIKIAICLFLSCINIIEKPIINILSWIIIFSMVNIILYDNKNNKKIYQILEIPVLILILSVCETVGVVILDFIFWKFEVHNIRLIIIDSMEITFSKLIVLIFYYLVISKLCRKDSKGKITRTQFWVEVVIIFFSIANLTVITSVISKVTSKTEHILLLVNMWFILFADLYFLYFARFADKYNQLKVKLRLLEQQSLLQYEYYAEQEEKYNESVKILHDVNNHLKMIENMYRTKEDEIAIAYTKEISQMLIPLALEEYTNNPILNVLLNDKKKIANYHDIKFYLEIGYVDLNFMEPIEITTIFGNLLDNAIEACDMVPNNKYIIMKLDKYYDFIVININNSAIPIEKWHLGKPISSKGKNHGIGLLNVENTIKKYNGSMLLEEGNKEFSCKIIFNQ
ncbi:sensor histidine kinase [Anaerosacchariphilus polymeriproducens]|uniref:ATP-binding protein n=1 Tax=Anaerosacchariphilus polymeriproducens TaxID=1812858 RepID=A0A371AZE4_9FIRM|nr:sensor histidine kinase [Anaerosacchariphilus polymeriproducens]RDU24964.1 ATP-binding protein [Anaerosacchariphilus polymeriproducens]